MATAKTSPAGRGRDTAAEVVFLTRALKAPTLREAVGRLAERARAESWSHEEFLVACLQREVSARESLSPVAGSLIDRLPRVHVMIAADLWRMALAAALPLVDQHVVGVYIIAFGLARNSQFSPQIELNSHEFPFR